MKEAYNKYDLELRLNTIIVKLDTIIRSLEQIKNNQFALYTAIKDTNKKIDNLTKDIRHQADVLNRISANTRITNYRLKTIEDNSRYKCNIDNSWAS